ncbi:hypothetical protein FPQ18DRAFT_396166 [Pyronema domesticum]|uniref:Uncharacterized protein n=1 Tax=Pyronema omphalodes (strain CBS 100304) TaxID=1076935 RepID=U4L6E3_PYROM|nr:hypothetical protein FPQ18DRAFT_396166 [Pyronema domesticum]CCX12981.1 Protein of unknown function [Pyronema omphalodes CBS 100304]
MQFLFPILLTLLALIAPVFSVPHNNHKRSPKNIKKAGGGPGPKVLVCTDENFKGDCEENVMNDGLCWILNGAYKRKVSSFKVEKGCCQFYMDEVCNRPLFSAMNREDATLKGEHNDRIRSYNCDSNKCPNKL